MRNVSEIIAIIFICLNAIFGVATCVLLLPVFGIVALFTRYEFFDWYVSFLENNEKYLRRYITDPTL